MILLDVHHFLFALLRGSDSEVYIQSARVVPCCEWAPIMAKNLYLKSDFMH